MADAALTIGDLRATVSNINNPVTQAAATRLVDMADANTNCWIRQSFINRCWPNMKSTGLICV